MAAAVTLALGLTGCVAGGPVTGGENDTDASGDTAAVVPVSAWLQAASDAAEELPVLGGPYTGTPLVAEGLLPPTNSWLSGAVFPQPVQPVFTGVLAVLPSDEGFTLGLPRPVVTEKTVFGSFPPDVPVELSSDAFELSAYDALSGTFAFSDGGEPLGALTLAQGWPYAYYSATAEQTVGLPAATGVVKGEGDERSVGVVTIGGTAYEFGTTGTVEAGSSSTAIELAAGDDLVIFARPAGSPADELALLRAGALELVGTTTDYETSGGEAITRLAFETESGASTVFASRPHQEITGADGEPFLAGYESIYGPLSLHAGSAFSFAVPEKTVTAVLDVSGLAEAEKETLAEQVEEDAASVDFAAPDTYYGGKALYRAAQLYGLATGLGLDDVAAGLAERMTAEFELWFDPAGCVGRSTKCFVYDPVLGGITGLQPAYGSDEFNDHHFHYGYFLSALSVIAADDETLVERFGAMADVLAADIAAPATTTAFPMRRSFDDYTGHSWASGTSPFADGNNQESASESVNAWAGLSLWAQASGNDELAAEASWQYSTESATATRYWLGAELPTGFTAPFFALNWAGKRDYATFFDATPSAILGVELLPMSPSTSFLPTDPAVVEAQVTDAIPGWTPGSATADGVSLELPLVDYVIMYAATVDRAGALVLAEALPESRVDNANTRSYLTAWILTRP